MSAKRVREGKREDGKEGREDRDSPRGGSVLSGEREVVRFWRLGMGVFFGGSSSPEKAKSTSSVSGFSSF
jgi:hypothetical protein